MNFEKYKVKMEVMQKPKKPLLIKDHTLEDVRKYASELEVYEKNLEKWKLHMQALRAEQCRLEDQFKQDLFVELDIEKHDKRHILYSKAWELGHAEGYHNVYHYATELIDLL